MGDLLLVEQTQTVSVQCSGQPFIHYCAASEEWQLAPASAWDTIDDEQCYNTATGAYHHALAIAQKNGSLADGFVIEWGALVWPARYVQAQASVSFVCPGDQQTPVDLATSEQKKNTQSNDSTNSSMPAWVVPVLVGAGILFCLSALTSIYFVNKLRVKSIQSNHAGPTMPGAVFNAQDGGSGPIVVGNPVAGAQAGGKKNVSEP